MRLKKIVALSMCLAMTASMVSGCGTKKDPAGNNDGKVTEGAKDNGTAGGTKEKQKITWLFWDDVNATEDLMSKEYAETVKRFNEADNGYECEIQTTNLEEYTTKLNALVASNTVPDVFIIDPGPRLTTYVDAGVTMDLTDTLNSDTAWKDTFTNGIFDRLTYDGKIQAVPLNFASACVFYNTEIFKKAGVEVPKTWTEFIDVCKKIKAAGYDPISVSAATPWCLSMIAGYLCDREGGPDNLTGIADKSVKWTDESFVNAAKKLVEMSKYFQKTYVGDSNDQATANFYNGTAAMLIQGSWAIAQINGNAPEMQEKTGVFQFPGIEGGSDPNRWIVKTDNIAVSKTTKNKDACIALLKEFTGETAQKRTAEIAGKMPVTNVTVDYAVAPKELSYVQESMKTLTGTLGFYNESLASVEAGSEFDNTMVSIVMGEITPEDGMKKFQKYYDEKVFK